MSSDFTVEALTQKIKLTSTSLALQADVADEKRVQVAIAKPLTFLGDKTMC